MKTHGRETNGQLQSLSIFWVITVSSECPMELSIMVTNPSFVLLLTSLLLCFAHFSLSPDFWDHFLSQLPVHKPLLGSGLGRTQAKTRPPNLSPEISLLISLESLSRVRFFLIILKFQGKTRISLFSRKNSNIRIHTRNNITFL